MFAEGVLEIMPDGFGFLRSRSTAIFLARTTYTFLVANKAVLSQDRRHSFGAGASPKDSERYFALLRVEMVNYEIRRVQEEGQFRRSHAAVSPGTLQPGIRRQGKLHRIITLRLLS